MVILILQALLAVWSIIGASYMIGHYQLLASSWGATLPSLFWIVLGVVQIVLSLALLAAIKSSWRKFAAPSAWILAIIYVLGLFIYGSYSGFPGMLWGIVPAVLFALVAWKRK